MGETIVRPSEPWRGHGVVRRTHGCAGGRRGAEAGREGAVCHHAVFRRVGEGRGRGAPWENTCGWNSVWCARVLRPVSGSGTVRRHTLATIIDDSTKEILTFMSARVQMSLQPSSKPLVNDSRHDKVCSASALAQPSLLRNPTTDTAIAAAFHRYLAATGRAVDDERGGAQLLDRRAARSQRRRHTSR